MEPNAYGRYVLIRQVGAGGMGEVYLAEDVESGRRVALKLLPRDRLRDEDARRRFAREAENAGRVLHPNVAAVYESGIDADDRPYLAMEFIDGAKLADIIARSPRPPRWSCWCSGCKDGR